MAYRRSNGKGRRTKKVEPAEMTMNFITPAVAAGASADFYIDLAQCASLLNRRFYRQGLNFPVSSIKVLATGVTGSIAVQKLPQTWIMSNAWMKGFKAWQKMNDEALEESESIRPRFLDFKIYADAQHHLAGFGANLLPRHLSQTPGGPLVPTTATPGEWESSKYQIPDNTLGATGGVREREVIAVGANFPGAGASGLNAVSLIEGYANSRGLPNVLDPNVPDDAGDVVGSGENWIAQLDSEGTQQIDAVIDDMISENNIAPYPFENDGVHTDTMYPSGANQLDGLQIHDFDYITATTVGGRTILNGGLFPCGLIKLSFTNTNTSGNVAFDIQINLVPGHHRGYLCEPMTEM